MVSRICDNEILLAIIIPSSHSPDGIQFYTEDTFSQQLATMRHPKGRRIDPHVHNRVERQVNYTQEVLIIRSGILRVDFYSQTRQYLESRLLQSGDVILLASGGHGFEVIEDIDMIEVKQGPYSGDQDKTRFPGVPVSELKLN